MRNNARVGLARALYGDPFLVVLDEPNSHLDADGETALTQAILDVRARGGVVIVIAHRPGALASVDLVGVVRRGKLHAFGPKEEILKAPAARKAAAAMPAAKTPLAAAAAPAAKTTTAVTGQGTTARKGRKVPAPRQAVG